MRGNQMNSIIHTLIEARAKVARRWVQGSSHDSQGGVCAQYAIGQAAHFNGIHASWAEVVLLDVIRDLYPARHWGSVPEWNDTPGRTKYEVLAAFDQAIKKVGGVPPADPPVEARIVVLPPPAGWHDVCAPVETSVVTKVRELVGV